MKCVAICMESDFDSPVWYVTPGRYTSWFGRMKYGRLMSGDWRVIVLRSVKKRKKGKKRKERKRKSEK